MESDVNFDGNPALLLLVVLSTLAMVDSSAHCRCDFGVMECCRRIVYEYPPLRLVSVDVCAVGGRVRVAEARRASQGFEVDCDVGLVILIVVRK